MVLIAIVATISIGVFLHLTRGVIVPVETTQDRAYSVPTATATDTQTRYRISQDDSQVTYSTRELSDGSVIMIDVPIPTALSAVIVP